MYLKCETSLLIENINLVARAVPTRSTVSILECVLLNAVDGKFTMMANDLKMAIETTHIESEIIEEGEIAIDAILFFEIIRKLPHGEVTIRSDKDNVVIIKCLKSEFKILAQDPLDFPVLPEIEKTECVTIKAQQFKDIVRKTIFSVASDETKGAMVGELITIKEGHLHFVAVDGYRIAFCKLPIDINLELKLVVPSKALNEIIRSLTTDADIDISMYYTANHILIEDEKFVFVTRLLDGEFIQYERLYDAIPTTIVTANKQELLSSLERSMLVAKKEIRKTPIRIEIENRLLTISSNSEVGTVFEEVNVEIDGANMQIAFNPRFLVDALKAIDEEIVLIKFTTKLSPVVMSGALTPEIRYLVLPLKTND